MKVKRGTLFLLNVSCFAHHGCTLYHHACCRNWEGIKPFFNSDSVSSWYMNHRQEKESLRGSRFLGLETDSCSAFTWSGRNQRNFFPPPMNTKSTTPHQQPLTLPTSMPPSVSGRLKSAPCSNMSKTVITLDPSTSANWCNTLSSVPVFPQPSKGVKAGSEDMLFQGGWELWLAKRLTDLDIYLPLQANKETPASPGVQHCTKAAIHQQLTSEFNQQKEHAGFIIDGGKIKNKIAKISQHFKLVHRFRYSLDFSNVDEMTWQDAVKEKCSHYFVLEPVWAMVWSAGISPHADSVSTLNDNVIT